MTFEDSLAKTQAALKQLENQDMESIGFVPTLEFGVLFSEAVCNMNANSHMMRSITSEKEHAAIINCKLTHEERMKEYKNIIGDY
jgi:hypothetical protein